MHDRVFDASFVEDLESLDMDDLRKRRESCEILEAEISYTRRLLQGKLDILKARLEAMSSERSRLASLRERLPAILGDGDGKPRADIGKHPRHLVPPNADKHRREVEVLASETTLAHLDELEPEQIEEIVDSLISAEAEASENRKTAQRIIDEIKAEIIRRYKEGHEDPTSVLSS